MKTIKRSWYAFPVLDIGQEEIGTLLGIFRRWDSQPYKWNGKSQTSSDPKPLDCSGFVGMALDAITRGSETPTDLWDRGSTQQWQELKKARFKSTTQFSTEDGALRIARIAPTDTASGIGHIAFVLDGYTIESCGSLGVCRRKWGSSRWMRRARGLVISAPKEEVE